MSLQRMFSYTELTSFYLCHTAIVSGIGCSFSMALPMSSASKVNTWPSIPNDTVFVSPP